MFVPPPQDNNTLDDDIPSQFQNGSIKSTAAGDQQPTPSPEDTTPGGELRANNYSINLVYRKHVTPVTQKNTAWWMRPKLPFNNMTANIHKINNKL